MKANYLGFVLLAGLYSVVNATLRGTQTLGPGSDICVVPYEEGNHVLSVPAGSSDFIPVIGFYDAEWGAAGFSMKGLLIHEDDVNEVSPRALYVNVVFSSPLDDVEGTCFNNGNQPCIKGHVDHSIFSEWSVYAQTVGVIEAVEIDASSALGYVPLATAPDWFKPGRCEVEYKDYYPQIGIDADDKNFDGTLGGSAWISCKDYTGKISSSSNVKHLDFNFQIEAGPCAECEPVNPVDPEPINPLEPFVPPAPLVPNGPPISCIANVAGEGTSFPYECRDDPKRPQNWGLYLADTDPNYSPIVSGTGTIQEATTGTAEGKDLIISGAVNFLEQEELEFVLEFRNRLSLDDCSALFGSDCPKFIGGQYLNRPQCSNTDDWEFYSVVSGIIFDGDVECKFIGEGGPGQIGSAANLHNANVGGSTWIIFSDDNPASCDKFGRKGDFNFDLIPCEEPFTPVTPTEICLDSYTASNNAHFLEIHDRQEGNSFKYIPADELITALWEEDSLVFSGDLEYVDSNGDENELQFEVEFSSPLTYAECLDKYSSSQCGKEEGGSDNFADFIFYEQVTGFIAPVPGAENEDFPEIWGGVCTFYQPAGKPLAQLGLGANAKVASEFGFSWWIWCENVGVEGENSMPQGDFNLAVLDSCPAGPGGFIPPIDCNPNFPYVPTTSPVPNPTPEPSAKPSDSPTVKPTPEPSATPSDSPTVKPTNQPVDPPTSWPTRTPPTSWPTRTPPTTPPPTSWPTRTPPTSWPTRTPPTPWPTRGTRAPTPWPTRRTRAPVSPTNAPPPPGGCRSAFAYHEEQGKCFNKISSLFSRKWGWSLGPLRYPTSSSNPTGISSHIYADAKYCQISRGHAVGKYTVAYFQDRVEVKATSVSTCKIKDAHLYLGHRSMPKNRWGWYETSPKKYPFNHLKKVDSNGIVTFTVKAHDFGWTRLYGNLYSIVHFDVCCEDQGSSGGGSPTSHHHHNWWSNYWNKIKQHWG